jgi:AraC-like DNA-binding protein
MQQTLSRMRRFPLSRRPLVRTHEPGRAVQAIHGLVEPFDFCWRARRDAPDIRVTGVLLERFKMFGVAHGTPVLVRSEPLRSHYLVLPVRGSVVGRPDGQPASAESGEALFYRAGSHLDATWSADCVALVIEIASGVLDAVARRCMPGVAAAPAVVPKLALSSGAGSSCANVLDALCIECNRMHDGDSMGFVRKGLQDLFLATLLEMSAPARARGSAQAPTRRRQFGVARAVECIERNRHRAVSARELAAAACLSVRSLQIAFTEHFGVGPMTYAKQMRLARVREELLAANPRDVSIAAVAGRWGFHNASAFSALYRQRFDELPSQTLRGPRPIAAPGAGGG